MLDGVELGDVVVDLDVELVTGLIDVVKEVEIVVLGLAVPGTHWPIMHASVAFFSKVSVLTVPRILYLAYIAFNAICPAIPTLNDQRKFLGCHLPLKLIHTRTAALAPSRLLT